jgi:hypothetical protein
LAYQAICAISSSISDQLGNDQSLNVPDLFLKW